MVLLADTSEERRSVAEGLFRMQGLKHLFLGPSLQIKQDMTRGILMGLSELGGVMQNLSTLTLTIGDGDKMTTDEVLTTDDTGTIHINMPASGLQKMCAKSLSKECMPNLTRLHLRCESSPVATLKLLLFISMLINERTSMDSNGNVEGVPLIDEITVRAKYMPNKLIESNSLLRKSLRHVCKTFTVECLRSYFPGQPN